MFKRNCFGYVLIRLAGERRYNDVAVQETAIHMARMNRIAILALPCLVVAAAQSPTDRDVLARIRAEGMERSQAAAVFNHLTIDIGPRLTASPAHKRAVDWTRDRLESYGLANVHVEPWTFGMGWTLDKLTIEMIEPRYLPLSATPTAGPVRPPARSSARPCSSAARRPRRSRRCGAQLKGAIVMSQPMMTNFVRKDRPQPSDPDYVPMSAAYATSVGRGRGGSGSRRNAAAARAARRVCAEGRRRGRDPQAERRRARDRVRHRTRRRARRGAVGDAVAPSTTT